MRQDLRILVAGFGNMGRALVRGWLDAGAAPADISIADSSAAACELAVEWGVAVHDVDEDQKFDVVVIAVKPQHVDGALTQFAGALRDGGVFVSVAAGRTLASLQRCVAADAALVRTMPNTPAAIARGTTVLCANAAVTADQRSLCGELLAAVGEVFWVEDEALLDAVTAVSGSGPAYVFLLIECLAAAGVRQGLSPELAQALASHTIAGSGEYAANSKEDIARLREQVTSPGGTTQAALEVFMKNDALRSLVDAAVKAAATRSRELSQNE